jgi:DNA-binding NarL/FixJ family response regulator
MEQQRPGRARIDETSVNRGSKITVLIADDHAIIRDGLSSMLEDLPDITVVAEASTGTDAVAQWDKHRPDITLMDLQMPMLDGIAAIQRIRQKDSLARIIILTTFEGDEDVYRGLSAGAKAYLLKDTTGNDLLKYIRAVHAGETCVPPSIAAKLASRLSETELTERETAVLRVLASGLSNKEIGGSLFISEMTVKAYLKKIFAKLHVASRTEAIAAATRRGIIHLEKQ